MNYFRKVEAPLSRYKYELSDGGTVRPGAVIVTCLGCGDILITLPPGSMCNVQMALDRCTHHERTCEKDYDVNGDDT